MDRIVGVMGCRDEVVRIQDQRISFFKVLDSHGDDVVDDRPFGNVESRNPEVTGLVSSDDLMTHVAPLP